MFLPQRAFGELKRIAPVVHSLQTTGVTATGVAEARVYVNGSLTETIPLEINGKGTPVIQTVNVPEVVREAATLGLQVRFQHYAGGFWTNSPPSYTGVTYNPPPSITSPLTASGTNGQAFAYTITATGNPTSYGSTGILPAGVDFNVGSGTFTGVAMETGTFEVLISATNAHGTDTETLVITIGGDPCAHLTAPPEGLDTMHVIDVPLKNETDQLELYRVSVYRVTFQRWGRNAADTDCVPIFESGGRVGVPVEYEVAPKSKLMVHLEHGFPFEYEIEKMVINELPEDPRGTISWEPQDAPTEPWGEHVPTRGRSESVPGTEGDNKEKPPVAAPPVVTPEAPPAPPTPEERPPVVNDQSTANQAAEARHKESQSSLGSIAEQLTKLLNSSKTQTAQNSTNANDQKQRDNKQQSSLDRIASRLEGQGHSDGGAGEAGSGPGPAGTGGENLPGSGGGNAGDWGGINPGSRLGVGSGQSSPLFVIPFGSLGITGLNDFPVDFNHERFAAWRGPVRAMLLAVMAVMFLLAAVDLLVNG